MDARGRADRTHGMAEIIVGTGGRNIAGLGSPSTLPPTLVTGQDTSFGALALTLRQVQLAVPDCGRLAGLLRPGLSRL